MKTYVTTFLIAALGALPVLAGPLERSCLVGHRTAATLLFPYFEVNLAAPDGTTTLLSIGNAHDEPALAHVVVWTDWGLPTIAFDLALDTGQVQSINLRARLAGQFPATGAGLDDRLDAPSCSFPIPPPPVDVAELRTRHTGQASPFSGLCYGSGRLGPDVATGYLTVDVVRDCSAGAIPGDPGYFDDGMGLATNDNHLFGEFFLLEPGEDFAQGIPAVSVVADTDLFEVGGAQRTFYRRWVTETDADDRTPLSSRHRARFLDGGGFGGTTDLLVWTGGIGADAQPQECGNGPFEDTPWVATLGFTLRNQVGEILGQTDYTPSAVTFRVEVGGDEIPLEPGNFGIVETSAILFGCFGSAPCIGDFHQTWIASLIRASGRFSVGVEATRLDDLCQF